MDPIFSSADFHEDILAYQWTHTNARDIIVLGERHVLPQNQTTNKVDPLETLRKCPSPLTMYVEISEQMQRAVQRQIIEDIDTNVMTKERRIERMAFQLNNRMWPEHIQALAINVRHAVPYNLLGWLSMTVEQVVEAFEDASMMNLNAASRNWESMRRDFEQSFVSNITDIETLRVFLHALIFQGSAPSWYMQVFKTLGVRVYFPIHQTFQTLPSEPKKRILQFFKTWFHECIASNGHGQLLSYLSDRNALFGTTSVVTKYPLTQHVFSYIAEIIMDIQLLIEYESRKTTPLHVVYVGARHAHRLGAYFGSLPQSTSRSWQSSAGWNDVALPYKLPNDDDDVQYVLASQLALPGGGTQSVKKRLTKKERDMYVNAYKEAVRQTRGWSLR